MCLSSNRAATPPRIIRRRTAFAVTAITLLGGLLRLTFLARTGVWNDEAATYGRVNGTYHELLEVLQWDGFAPLHYELYWLLARVVNLTPVWLRMAPAICGTLAVAAMYPLARQFVSRSAAIAVMLLAATSAYQLYYSRDAKMYAPMWLASAVSFWCVLRFVRTGRRVYWLAWVAASTALVGLHTPGYLALAVQAAMVATHPRRTWGRAALYVLGMAVISIGPVSHYNGFNRWAEKIDQRGVTASMLQWIDAYNRDRSGPQLVQFTASAYLTGWEWPHQSRFVPRVDPSVIAGIGGFCGGVLALAVLGVLPWRRWSGERRAGHPMRGGGMLTAWLVVPAYAVYVRGGETPTPPWLMPGEASWPVLAAMGVGLAVLVTDVVLTRPDALRRLARVAAWAAGLAAVMSAIWAFEYVRRKYQVTWSAENWWTYHVQLVRRVRPVEVISLWMPRYLGIAWPAFAIAGVSLLWRLPSAGLRWTVVGVICTANLANHAAKLAIDPEPPVAAAVTDILTDRASDGRVLTYVDLRGNPGYEPGMGWVTAHAGRYQLSIRLPTPLLPADFGYDMVPGRLPEPLAKARTYRGSRAIRGDLARAPGATTVILWRRSNDPLMTPEDLGPDWRLTSSVEHQAYDHWMWARTMDYRRSVYTRATP